MPHAEMVSLDQPKTATNFASCRYWPCAFVVNVNLMLSSKSSITYNSLNPCFFLTDSDWVLSVAEKQQKQVNFSHVIDN